MNHFYGKVGLGHNWWVVVFSELNGGVAGERSDHFIKRDNDAVARKQLYLTLASHFPPLHNFKGTKPCRVVSFAYKNGFQNSTGHSNVFKTQPIVDITSPARLSVCSATSLLIYEQIKKKRFFLPSEIPALCCLHIDCLNQRSFFFLHIVRLSIDFLHELAGIVEKRRGELIPFKKDRLNALNLALSAILRTLH